MDTATLHSLATVISSTIDSFLAAQDETHVHSITLKFCPENEDAASYCEMSVSQTVTVVQRGTSAVHEAMIRDDLEQEGTIADEDEVPPPLRRGPFRETDNGLFVEEPSLKEGTIREATLADMEAHIADMENNEHAGVPPLTEAARRARQAAAELLLREQRG